jgi:hypothetical protein
MEKHQHLHFALRCKNDQAEGVVKLIFRSAVRYHKMGCGIGNWVKIPPREDAIVSLYIHRKYPAILHNDNIVNNHSLSSHPYDKVGPIKFG